MEEAKNARAVLRRAFTNSITTLDQYLSAQLLPNLEIERSSLSKIYDKLESNLRALESLGVTSDSRHHRINPSLKKENVLRKG